MFGKPITYTDFNDQKHTETFWFHLSMHELIEMSVDVPGGMGALLERITEAKDGKQIISVLKKIILDAYGVRSEDGKRFIKNEQLREEFYQSAAYATLFMEFATNAGAGAEFIQNIMPKDIDEQIKKITEAEKAATAELANQ